MNKSTGSNVDLNELALKNVEALADGDVNPMCPNGCYDNSFGCFFYHWFPTHKEAEDDEIHIIS